MSNDLDVFFPEPRIIKIADRETREILTFEIREFVFENRTKFVKIISQIFADLAKQKNIKDMSQAEAISMLIDIAGDKLADIYMLVLDKPLEWVKKNITLKNEVDILTAVLEVNEIPFLVSQIRKVIQKSS